MVETWKSVDNIPCVSVNSHSIDWEKKNTKLKAKHKDTLTFSGDCYQFAILFAACSTYRITHLLPHKTM